MAITNWKVAVLLVSFQDSTAVHRRTLQFYQNMFINSGTGGLVDYWEGISFTRVNFAGSQVFNWKVFPGTVAQFIQQTAATGRGGKAKLVMDLFTNVNFANFNSVIVVPDANVQDAGAASANGKPVLLSNVDLLGQNAAHANFFAHEMGHNFGLPHSSGVDEGLGYSWVGPYEYADPWDVMGGVNPFGAAYTFSNATFTKHGIGLHAKHLHTLGWLEDLRIKSFTLMASGRVAGTPDDLVTLQPLYSFETPLGFPAARVNFTSVESNKPESYWIEIRTNTGWDQGAPGTHVLIRKVADDGLSYLIYGNKALNRVNWLAGEVFIDERNNIRIGVDAIVATGNVTATIRIGSFVNQPSALGALGSDVQCAGIALSTLNAGARPELVTFVVENLTNENKGLVRVAPDMSLEGVPSALGAERLLPNWGHHENQKGDISIAKVQTPLKANAMPVVVFVDNPGSHNQAHFRVGLDLQATGTTTWTARTEIPLRMADTCMGAAVALAHLDTNVTKPDIIAAFADKPVVGKPWFYYRVAKDMELTGAVGAWGPAIDLPKFYGYTISGIGIAVADLRNAGQRDIVFFVMDKSSGVNKGHYIVGRNLDASGIVRGGWTDWTSVPGTFGTDIRDVSIEVSNLFTTGGNHWSLLVFTAEKATPTSTCNGHLRLMKRIKM